jgi:D-alanyl-D-alanine carboxypeptidase
MEDNLTLLQKEQLFAQMAAVLIQHAKTLGYEVTLGEAYRTPEQAQWNAEHGKGIAHSLHMLRLAIDLNLYKDGVWLQNADDHRRLGEWWESQGGTWGGRFGDGNH